MFILAFLVLGGMVWLLGLAFVTPVRHRAGLYTALSLLFVLVATALFAVLTTWTGIADLTPGTAHSLSVPDDYVARGGIGIAILLEGVLGVVSPALAAWLVSRPSAAQSSGPRSID